MSVAVTRRRGTIARPSVRSRTKHRSPARARSSPTVAGAVCAAVYATGMAPARNAAANRAKRWSPSSFAREPAPATKWLSAVRRASGKHWRKLFLRGVSVPRDGAPLPRVLRGATRGCGMGVPDVRLHPPDSWGREGGHRVHGPRLSPVGGLRVRPGTDRPDLGSRADGPRTLDDRELPAPGPGHVRDRRVPRRSRRAETPIGARPGRGRLEEIVELQILRLVVREQRRDCVLDQVDPLAEIVRHL